MIINPRSFILNIEKVTVMVYLLYYSVEGCAYCTMVYKALAVFKQDCRVAPLLINVTDAKACNNRISRSKGQRGALRVNVLQHDVE